MLPPCAHFSNHKSIKTYTRPQGYIIIIIIIIVVVVVILIIIISTSPSTWCLCVRVCMRVGGAARTSLHCTTQGTHYLLTEENTFYINSSHFTPLHHAAMRGQTEVLETLGRLGADLRARTPNGINVFSL